MQENHFLFLTNLQNTESAQLCFGGLWVNKISVSFLQQLDLKNKHKR